MIIYVIQDNCGSAVKIATAKGLIDYANHAHFVEGAELNKQYNGDTVEPCTDVEGAKHILSADMYYVEEFDTDKVDILTIMED